MKQGKETCKPSTQGGPVTDPRGALCLWAAPLPYPLTLMLVWGAPSALTRWPGSLLKDQLAQLNCQMGN